MTNNTFALLIGIEIIAVIVFVFYLIRENKKDGERFDKQINNNTQLWKK